MARWKAEAQYGSSPDHLEPVDMTVTVSAPDVTLAFVSGQGYHVTLKVVKPNVLEGTQTVSGG